MRNMASFSMTNHWIFSIWMSTRLSTWCFLSINWNRILNFTWRFKLMHWTTSCGWCSSSCQTQKTNNSLYSMSLLMESSRSFGPRGGSTSWKMMHSGQLTHLPLNSGFLRWSRPLGWTTFSIQQTWQLSSVTANEIWTRIRLKMCLSVYVF